MSLGFIDFIAGTVGGFAGKLVVPKLKSDKVEDFKTMDGHAPGFLSQMLGHFGTSCPRLLSGLAKAIHEEDTSTTYTCAHTLKGTAANAGCSLLAEEARQIMLASESDLEGCSRWLRRAKATYAESHLAWDRHVESYYSSGGSSTGSGSDSG